MKNLLFLPVLLLFSVAQAQLPLTKIEQFHWNAERQDWDKAIQRINQYNKQAVRTHTVLRNWSEEENTWKDYDESWFNFNEQGTLLSTVRIDRSNQFGQVSVNDITRTVNEYDEAGNITSRVRQYALPGNALYWYDERKTDYFYNAAGCNDRTVESRADIFGNWYPTTQTRRIFGADCQERERYISARQQGVFQLIERVITTHNVQQGSETIATDRWSEQLRRWEPRSLITTITSAQGEVLSSESLFWRNDGSQTRAQTRRQEVENTEVRFTSFRPDTLSLWQPVEDELIRYQFTSEGERLATYDRTRIWDTLEQHWAIIREVSSQYNGQGDLTLRNTTVSSSNAAGQQVVLEEDYDEYTYTYYCDNLRKERVSYNEETGQPSVKLEYSYLEAPECAEELPQESMMVYPNPSRDIFYLRSDFLSGEPATVSVFDTSGRTVLSYQVPERTPEVELNLGQYPPGLYFVQLSSGNRQVTRKLLKTDR